MVGEGKIIVAVPVKNEEARIGTCLAGLSMQTYPSDGVLLLLNNCTDGTLELCRAWQSALNITIVECTLAGPLACAGEGRRLALAQAQTLAGEGIILTTDADAAPDSDWIGNNLAAMRRGADVVCGQARIMSDESRLLPPGLHFDDMREGFLLSLLDEMDALVDPDPADPWPRHQQRSGASIAMRAAMLRQAGGAPHVSTGEDRALVDRFRLFDARIRHELEIVVPVSGRLEGRATAGMAATMKRRIETRDALTDDRLEPAVDSYRRSLAKARFRACRRDAANAASFAADLLIANATLTEALGMPYFGAAWAMVQAASPVLQYRRVAFANLARETRQAMQLRDMLNKAAAQAMPTDADHHAIR